MLGIISGLFLFFGWIFNVKGLVITALCLSSLFALLLTLALIADAYLSSEGYTDEDWTDKDWTDKDYIGIWITNIFQYIFFILSIVLL